MKTPWWFLHKTPLAFLLWPISVFYYIGSKMVFSWRKLFAYKSRRKIVCFGGILAGGVGKTPIVRAIAQELDAPVVMRGYKSSNKTAYVGDEAMMLANDGIAVHVGDRKSNVMLLNRQKNEKGPILMDDGLQNPRIVKDISIIVFDQGLGFGNGFLLPAGPLRESKRRVGKVDAVIVIKNKKPRKNFVLPPQVPVFWATPKTISPYPNGTKIMAFAGIGYPKKFFNSVSGIVAKRAFADHYQYTDKDIDDLIKVAKKKNAKLLTTEKDWMRLPDAAKEKIKFAKYEMEIDAAFLPWLKEKLDVND